jgi:hypothetical protein
VFFPSLGRGLLVLVWFSSARYRSRMPKDAFTLSNVREPTLTIVCPPCARRGRYNVNRLIAKHGDAKLLYLLDALTNCPRRSPSTFMTAARRATNGSLLGSVIRCVQSPAAPVRPACPHAAQRKPYGEATRRPVQRFGFAPEAAVARRVRRIDRLGDDAFKSELAGMAAHKLLGSKSHANRLAITL